MDRISEVKKKREFSQLPDSVVERAVGVVGEDVKEVRALLRKYFGVFLTNKVLKGEGVEILKSHKSSQHRNYEEFYGKIFSIVGDIGSVEDLGCGVNSFSYKFLPSGVNYVGVEAVGQLVDSANNYFSENGFEKAKVLHGDLFDSDVALKVLKKAVAPRVVFMFQVIDALESFERDFSKDFLKAVVSESEFVVVSYLVKSLSGGVLKANRKWLVEFAEENFNIVDSFELDGERVLIFN
jgi:hypothetical protein